jgi:hypothetical protein
MLAGAEAMGSGDGRLRTMIKIYVFWVEEEILSHFMTQWDQLM